MTTQVIQLRLGQQEVLKYHSGKMGISAVPGSGKTWTLAYLAANLINEGAIGPDQEILVVTLVNAAVDNFSTRIAAQLQSFNLLPDVNYRVRTLHGLANDIVRERPDLAGLSTGYQIIDEVEADRIKKNIALDWLNSHPNFFEPYLDYLEKDKQKIYQGKTNLPKLIEDIANAFISLAKDYELTPQHLKKQLMDLPIPLPFAVMGTEMYSEYQQALTYRGAIDFDDLIRLALRSLISDPSLLELLRKRWPFILEDEAQDSSRLQQKILSLLAGEEGNWVRVGDPNQAIYESFTTASPSYLINFLSDTKVDAKTLPESGRSTQSIIELANHLIEWTQNYHPNPAVRNALEHPLIQTTSPGDPQPNPTDCPACIRFVESSMTSDQERDFVVSSAGEFIQENPQQTVAILCLSNPTAFKYTEELEKRKIPYVDSLLRSTNATRLSTGAIAHILRYLSQPTSSPYLSDSYLVWRRKPSEVQKDRKFTLATARLIKGCRRLEDYLWPAGEDIWLDEIAIKHDIPGLQDELCEFRNVVRHWQAAIFLPIDQLLLTIAQDLFLDPAELALAHKLSTLLRQLSDSHPDWRLPEFRDELLDIAKNERRFLGLSQDDDAFDPDRYPGKVIVATMHKAKGLEWDCVFLTALNNYNFPSGEDYDQYFSEKYFVRDRLNLQAETLAQLNTIVKNQPHQWYQPGQATLQAREEYIRERLRLFFVGVTRARRSLTLTWNTGRPGNNKNVPAAAFLAAINYLKGK